MADHNEFGKIAENLAADFLTEKGYKILLRNYRFMKAEVDIICELDDQIIFVEVKARATDAFMEPHEAVTKKKMRLVISAADHFMNERNFGKEARFDIISVLPDKSGKLQISHLEDAFNALDAQ